ncbi:hypothetical protein [Shewanella halifaxensis]|nr:hypothetical protein [Shewanella halifaxensis]
MENYFLNIYHQSDFALCKIPDSESELKQEQDQTEEREDETPSYILGYN